MRRLTAAELVAAGLDVDPPIGSGWGPWDLNATTLALELRGRYWVDLERCDNAAEVLDWIAQVAKKTWADDATLAGLVRALDDVLDLQAHLCPWGQPGRLTGADIRKQARAIAKHSKDKT